MLGGNHSIEDSFCKNCRRPRIESMEKRIDQLAERLQKFFTREKTGKTCNIETKIRSLERQGQEESERRVEGSIYFYLMTRVQSRAVRRLYNVDDGAPVNFRRRRVIGGVVA